MNGSSDNAEFKEENSPNPIAETLPSALAETETATVPPSPQPEIILAVSSDRRQAFLTIKQTPPAPYMATTEDVYNALASAGFEFGILYDKIEKIIDSKLYITQTLVAELPTPHISIVISGDKLQALLTITQTPLEPYMATVEDVYNALSHAGVEYGVLTDKIEQIIAGRTYPELVVVAQGQAPEPGTDGQLEYRFTRGKAGQANDLGYRVDYHNLNLVENVHAGQALVVMTPAVEGKPGMTVHGRPISVHKVKKVRLPSGKGTKISAENPLELVAEVNGFVRLDRTSFEQIVVEQEFQVLGNVDLSTGNLNIEGSVRINKDVRDGFQVKATGNIVVLGSVEGCYLEAGGDIEIKGGIIGGKQRARAQAIGDVLVKFADNADISAGGTISVADEVLNCNLQTERVVVVGERGKSMGSIIGGQIIAGQEIRADSAGTSAGTLTRLRVGERPNLLARRHIMERELIQQEMEFEQLELRIKSLLEKQANRRSAREDRQVLRSALEQQQEELVNLMNEIIRQGEEAGLVTPRETIRTLQNETEETRQNLARIETSALNLLKKINNKSDAGTEADQDMLVQLKLARQNLANKLKLQEIQLGQLTKDPWKKLPWAWRRELEVTQVKLQTIAGQITTMNTEDAFDQKVELAITQSINGRDSTIDRLEALRAEFAQVQHEIDSLSKASPHVIITGKLWAGTEVIVSRQKERFNMTLNSVRIQLSTGDQDDRRSIITLPL